MLSNFTIDAKDLNQIKINKISQTGEVFIDIGKNSKLTKEFIEQYNKTIFDFKILAAQQNSSDNPRDLTFTWVAESFVSNRIKFILNFSHSEDVSPEVFSFTF